MPLSREEIKNAMKQWNLAWNNHDLEEVMKLFHDEALFENWTGGKVMGKEALRKTWTPWFANHGGFRFIEEETFIDEKEQKVLYRWQLEWPSSEKGYEGKIEKRRGVDVIHFQDGKIMEPHGQSPWYLHRIPSYAKASEGYPPSAKSAEAAIHEAMNNSEIIYAFIHGQSLWFSA